MVYLSWSIIQFITVAVMLLVTWLVAYKLKLMTTKNLLIGVSGLFTIILFMAFDVGARQEYLQRNSFDATVPTEMVEKQERSTLDRNTVNKTFEQTVKETK